MSDWLKITLTVVGLGLVSVGTVYQANESARLMAYVAGGAMSIGSYLVGLFQQKPGGN